MIPRTLDQDTTELLHALLRETHRADRIRTIRCISRRDFRLIAHNSQQSFKLEVRFSGTNNLFLIVDNQEETITKVVRLSSTSAQRRFFREISLLKYLRQNGFANIPRLVTYSPSSIGVETNSLGWMKMLELEGHHPSYAQFLKCTESVSTAVARLQKKMCWEREISIGYVRHLAYLSVRKRWPSFVSQHIMKLVEEYSHNAGLQLPLKLPYSLVHYDLARKNIMINESLCDATGDHVAILDWATAFPGLLATQLVELSKQFVFTPFGALSKEHLRPWRRIGAGENVNVDDFKFVGDVWKCGCFEPSSGSSPNDPDFFTLNLLLGLLEMISVHSPSQPAIREIVSAACSLNRTQRRALTSSGKYKSRLRWVLDMFRP